MPADLRRVIAAERVRLHRNERSPFVGVEAATTFMASTFKRVTWAVLHAEAAESGDLAFTAGSYDGAWKLAFETNGIR